MAKVIKFVQKETLLKRIFLHCHRNTFFKSIDESTFGQLFWKPNDKKLQSHFPEVFKDDPAMLDAEKRTNAEIEKVLSAVRKKLQKEDFCVVKEYEDGKKITLYGGTAEIVIDNKNQKLSLEVLNKTNACLLSKYLFSFAPLTQQPLPLLMRNAESITNIAINRIQLLLGEELSKSQLGQHFCPKEKAEVNIVTAANNGAHIQYTLYKMVSFLAQTSYGSGKRRLKLHETTHVIGKVLWDNIDREIAGYALAMAGRKVNSNHYNFVWRNLEDVRHLYNTTPALLPVFAATMIEKDVLTKVPGDYSQGQFPELNKVNDIVPTIQKALGNISHKSWRYLCKLKPRWAGYLSVHFRIHKKDIEKREVKPIDVFGGNLNAIHITSILNILSEIGEMPKYTTFRAYTSGVKYSNDAQLEGDAFSNYISFCRTAFRESLKKKKNFYFEEFSVTKDWFSRAIGQITNNYDYPAGAFTNSQRKSPWSWYMRKQKEWHDEATEFHARRAAQANAEYLEKRKNMKWESIVAAYEDEKFAEYSVIPLLTADELGEEGKVMHHCVGSYADACMNGQSRIFSIRKENKSVATVEIGILIGNKRGFDPGALEGERLVLRRSNAITMRQTRGPCNAEVDDTIKDIVNRLLQKYKNTSKEINEAKTELQFAEIP